MKNTIKRICASLLAAMMVFTYMPAMAFADDTVADGWATDHSYYMQDNVRYDSVEVTTIDATCTEDGSTTYSVEVGDNVVSDVVAIPAIGHDWGEWAETKAPTCTQKGTAERVCANDTSHKETKDIDALGHEYEVYSSEDASCTEPGTIEYRCIRYDECGESKVETEAALGHDWELVNVTKEPTCTEEGEAVYKCANCGEEKTEAIPASHVTATKEDNVVAATCESPETYDVVVYCTKCGKEISRKTETRGVALGHDWDDGKVTTAATCAAEGVLTYTCDRCGKTRTESIEKVPHGEYDFVEFNIKPASCSEEEPDQGLSKYVIYCEVCGEELFTVEGPAGFDPITGEFVETPHKFDPAKEEVKEAATCTEAGKATNVCTVCGEKVEYALPALGHDWGEVVRENVKEATCTEDGSYEEVEYCTVCKERHSLGTKIIAATGHDWEVIGEKAPTCTAWGNIGVRCKNNPEEVYTIASEEDVDAYAEMAGFVPAVLKAKLQPIPHTYKGTVTTPADCTTETDGVMTYTCTMCKEASYTEVIPWEHDWDGTYKVVKEPTCTSTGLANGYCNKCKETKEQVLQKIPHTPAYDSVDYEWLYTGPDAAVVHVTYDTVCGVCGEDLDDVEEDVLYVVADEDFQDDSIKYIETKPATCKAMGQAKYVFTSEKLKSGITVVSTTYTDIPKLAHVQAAPVKENVKEATCTTDGSYDLVVYCSVCGDELTRETITDEDEENLAFGHDYGEQTEVERVEPTCTKDGYYVLQRVCANDPTHVRKTTVKIDALGHDWRVVLDPDNTVDPTCVDAGVTAYKMICDRCDAVAGIEDFEAVDSDDMEEILANSGITEFDLYTGGYTFNEDLERVTVATKPTGVHTPVTVRENETATTYDKVVKCSVCGYEISRETVAQESYEEALEDAQDALDAAADIDDSYPAESVAAVEAAAAELQALLDAGETDPAKIEAAVDKLYDAIDAAETAKEAAEEAAAAEEEAKEAQKAAEAAVAAADKLDAAQYTAESMKAVEDAKAALAEAQKTGNTAAIKEATKALEDAVKAASKKDKSQIAIEDSTKTYNGKPVEMNTPIILGSTGEVSFKFFDSAMNILAETPTDAGIYYVKAVVAADDNYLGAESHVAKLTIAKAKNTLTAKAKAATAKSNKKTVIKKAKAFTVSKAVGKVTFKKTSGNKKITVSKAGKVTVKKGLKKGTYKVKVKVTAAGDNNYKKGTKTVTLKIKVK